MLSSYLRLSPNFNKLSIPKLGARTPFPNHSRRFARAVEPLSEESSEEQPKRRWLALAGIGLTGASILGFTVWAAIPEEPQAPQLDVFQDYELLKNKRISNTSNLLTIQPSTFGPRAYKSSLDNERVADAARKGVWSVQIKHPLLTIARLYTPLPPFLSDSPQPTAKEEFGVLSMHPEENQLRFLIRNNPEGELSKYLSRMQAGGRLELRGPYQEFVIPEEVENIVFLAGGTGISPAIQVAHSLLESPPNRPKPSINILWANRRAEDCSGGSIAPHLPPENIFLRAWSNIAGTGTTRSRMGVNSNQPESPIVSELSTLKARYTGHLDINYFADDQQRFITQQDIQRRLQNSVRGNSDRESGRNSGSNLILISGPDGFVEYFAGPKVWKDGKELQGNLGGLLKNMDIHGWAVWKL
ncbi:MAG: hypothetical protein LQ343_001699 [Gyalolechia ehrenbergii]|nr:MAG: hypothetical protein LQ343_001699 [Gyalolechia ehrenbergii]